MSETSPAPEKFDAYARSYDDLHKSSVASSGEDPDYFHDYKIGCLARLGLARGPLLDYGCGPGNLTRRLVGRVPEVHGYDPSAECLAEAASVAPGAHLHDDASAIPREHFEVAVLAGVLHHVPKTERRDVLRAVRASLRPGGRVVVFEHNPLNPLTRRAVKDCPFDDDAVLLYPWEARRLLRESGFSDVRLDYIVFFPRALAPLRPLEPRLRRLALGAQLMLVATRAS